MKWEHNTQSSLNFSSEWKQNTYINDKYTVAAEFLSIKILKMLQGTLEKKDNT